MKIKKYFSVYLPGLFNNLLNDVQEEGLVFGMRITMAILKKAADRAIAIRDKELILAFGRLGIIRDNADGWIHTPEKVEEMFGKIKEG